MAFYLLFLDQIAKKFEILIFSLERLECKKKFYATVPLRRLLAEIIVCFFSLKINLAGACILHATNEMILIFECLRSTIRFLENCRTERPVFGRKCTTDYSLHLLSIEQTLFMRQGIKIQKLLCCWHSCIYAFSFHRGLYKLYLPDTWESEHCKFVEKV
jgi:hypothetical protein